MKKLYIKNSICIMLITLALQACRKQDHFYKDFMKGGEIIYVAKPDIILVQPGKERIQLSWKVSDQNINGIKFYWNSRQDSLIATTSAAAADEDNSVMIDNLDERLYSFEVFTLDALGNKSVRIIAEGQVYGDDYASTLLNRAIKTAVYKTNVVTITWFAALANTVETEITYLDSSGATETVIVPPATVTTVLNSVNPLLSFKYRTKYLPSPLAIDSFYSGYTTQVVN